MEKLNINQWAEEDRPREKMMQKGAEALSDAELLAILIGSGTPEVTSVDLMRTILREQGDSLRTLGAMTRQELERYNGIGPAKAVTIQAAMELGKRLLREAKGAKVHLACSTDAYDYFRSLIMDIQYEECHLLLLNVKNNVVGHHLVSRGGISESTVDIRLILRHALVAGTPNIMLAHNHPSGNPMPSRQDDDLTQRIRQACQTVSPVSYTHLTLPTT